MHEGELGGPFYRRPEAVAVNGDLRRVITARQWIGRRFEGLGSISGSYWCRSPANLGWSWRNGAGPRWGGRTGTSAAESALRALWFTTRVAARSGEWKATAASSGGLGGAGWHRRRRASRWRPQSRRWRRSRGGAPSAARRRRPQGARRSCGAEDKGEGTGHTATQRHWRDRRRVLKKTTVHCNVL